MKIAVLTSSRADFGIYLSLLSQIEQDATCQLEIIAFGTHLSKYHGYTINQISEAGFTNIHQIATLLTNDDEVAIATAYGLTALKFADFWNNHSYDWVLCLGDRFEMAAAVQAGIPYGVNFAHLHGGETTLGAIDNIYRHQITLASKMHFVATDIFADRIKEITGSADNIHVVGSLSIDQLSGLPVPGEDAFRKQYNISGDFALLTFHPETVSPHKNQQYAHEMKTALAVISKQVFLLITMPNADTFGTVFREALFELQKECPESVLLIENLGKLNYFAAMRYSKLLIGNTSSGIIEAASFGKYVVNVGDRQKGRAKSANVFDAAFEADEIVETALSLLKKGEYQGDNIYYKPGTAQQILLKLNTNES